MKNKAISTILLMFVSMAITQTVFGQDSKEDKQASKEIVFKNAIQSKNFAFVAQIANPQGGRPINLTSVYNLKMAGDSLIADLPYFGRAYVAPINTSEGGIRFTTKGNDYSIKEKKRGWDVTIVPKGAQDVRQMFLSVSKSGFATLSVISNNRQSISFNGYVIPGA